MFQKRKPYGYKDLLVYKKAEELQKTCADYTSVFSKTKTLISLADQNGSLGPFHKTKYCRGLEKEWEENMLKNYGVKKRE